MKCKKCKASLISGVKCNVCLSYYHTSCGKLLSKGKFNSEDVILCCNRPCSPFTEDTTPEPNDIIDLSNITEPVDATMFKYVMQQKDVIIEELRSKIDLLQEKICLLEQLEKERQKLSQSSITPVAAKQDKQKVNKENGGSSVKVSVKGLRSPAMTSKSPEMSSKSPAMSSKSPVMSSPNIKSIQPTMKVQPKALPKRHNDEWNLVEKKKRKAVVGCFAAAGCSLKAIPKLMDLHVYRLHPDTKKEDVLTFVKSHFPEAKCEELEAKHKGEYSSFKLSVYADNFGKALDPNIWPVGACVRKFFHFKKINE
ncbi:hypothetical protein Zmor_022792 [Zophobas morio]|uniref:Uncharacterized protein n=1 Tax=Zophobas morio TaxID=2755281 RepID=A0AA38HWP1_9CUCU|nr:hypothetical protein Zmor_022792 [Zophobas morio]